MLRPLCTWRISSPRFDEMMGSSIMTTKGVFSGVSDYRPVEKKFENIGSSLDSRSD